MTEEEVKQILIKLDVNKACGHDSIGYLMLNNLLQLAKSLKLVFQTSLTTGTFHLIWEASEVKPIYKEHYKADISQYRPISFLLKVPKVFNKMFPLIEPYLHRSQYGLMQKKSSCSCFYSLTTSPKWAIRKVLVVSFLLLSGV